MKKMYFGMVYEDKEKGGYWIDFPDFGCAVTQGETLEELAQNAADMLDTYVISMVEHGDDLPAPSDAKGIKAKADPDNGEAIFVMPVTVYPPAKTERINITASGDKLSRITDYAKRHNMSRSEFMVRAALEKVEA